MNVRRLLVFLGLAISAGALYWALRGIAWNELGSALAGVPLWTPFGAVTLYLLSFLPRAYRNRIMLRKEADARLTPERTGEAQVMGFAANNVLPLRLGEVVRVLVLHRSTGVPRSTALASLLAERILDGLFVVLVLGTTVTWSMHQGHIAGTPTISTLLKVGSALFMIAIVCLVALAYAGRWVMRSLGRILPDRVHGPMDRMLDALAFFRDGRRAVGTVVLTAMVWLCEGAVFALVVGQFGVDDPFRVGYFMLAVVNLGILLPSAPGYIGVFQACGMLAFEALHLSREQGLAASVVIHACQFIPITVIGLLLASRHGWDIAKMAHTKIETAP
ncbi:MAG: flippase-like domain-containing protein [Flavobacteriales bacterium]|nr:flippase-like domain-containing protein [Flavobacteriales bacterium]